MYSARWESAIWNSSNWETAIRNSANWDVTSEVVSFVVVYQARNRPNGIAGQTPTPHEDAPPLRIPLYPDLRSDSQN